MVFSFFGFAILVVILGVVGLLFFAGHAAAVKLSNKPGVQVLLTILFGLAFNIALATAAVAGCFAIFGGLRH